MIVWLNIASVGEGLLLPDLLLLRGSREVPVYSTELGELVGRTLSYEIRGGEDLWARAEIRDGTPEFSRSASVLTREPSGPVLHGVMVTNLERDELRSLMADMLGRTS